MADFAAGDKQQAVDAGKSGRQGRGAGIVRLAHLHAGRSEADGLSRRADQGDDIRRGHAAGRELFDCESAKAA